MIILYIVEENRYCLQAFSTEEILKRHINDCFKQGILPRKGEYVKCKNHQKKIKKPIMIYGDFESIYSHKRMQCKIQKSLIRTYIKSMLLVVMDID